MSARKINGSWYVDFRFDHKRIRKKSPEDSRAGAQAFERLLRQQLILNAGRLESAEPSFREFADHWFATYVKSNNKPSEQQSKRYILNAHLLPRLGSRPLSDIRASHIEDLKACLLTKGLKAKTVNNVLAVLGKCLRSANEWEVLGSVPPIRQLRVPPQKFQYLNDEEVQLLLDNAEPAIADMVLAALLTGLRYGELAALRWEDVDLERSHIVVARSISRGIIGSPKSNRTRRVPMPSRLVRAFASRAASRSADVVFPGPDGATMRYRRARNALRRSCTAAGIPQVGWHALRHTYASSLASRGASLRIIQRLLGHSTVQMTERYAHLLPGVTHEAVRLLDRPLNHGPYLGIEARPSVPEQLDASSFSPNVAQKHAF